MQLFHFHHCKRHLKKRMITLDPLPPAYAVYARENDDNYGRPLICTRVTCYTSLHMPRSVVVCGHSNKYCGTKQLVVPTSSIHVCNRSLFCSESVPVNSKVCFIKFDDAANVGVALHLTNTVFIDRALIVVPATFSTFHFLIFFIM